MQRDRIETALVWFANASCNLNFASEIVLRYPSFACFHAQQAAELALKAALISIADEHPRTNVGDVLVRELRALDEAVPDDVVISVRQLDDFYRTARYPSALGGADPLQVFSGIDAVNALGPAKAVLIYAESVIDREARRRRDG